MNRRNERSLFGACYQEVNRKEEAILDTLSDLKIQISDLTQSIDRWVAENDPEATLGPSAIIAELGEPDDLVMDRVPSPSGESLTLLYLKSITDPKVVQAGFVAPLTSTGRLQATESHPVASAHEAIDCLLSGDVLVMGRGAAWAGHAGSPPQRQVSKPANESSTKGPHVAFVEELWTNIGLLRTYTRDPRLDIKLHTLKGPATNRVALVYIQGLARSELAATVSRSLDRARTAQAVTDTSVVAQLITEHHGAAPLFPITQITERPDRVVGALYEGRAVLFLEGSPMAALIPSGFLHFLQPEDDYYFPPLYATAQRILRLIAILVTLLGAASFVAVSTINVELLPSPLFLSFAKLHEQVPFPIVIEVFMMEIVIELVRSAGKRIPGSMGQTISILGAVVVGQAAVSAGLVSAPVVVVTALGFLASFVVSDLTLSAAFRLTRFVFLFAGAVLGLSGIAILGLLLLFHLGSITSFGLPYLSPVAPVSGTHPTDALIKWGAGAKRSRRQSV